MQQRKYFLVLNAAIVSVSILSFLASNAYAQISTFSTTAVVNTPAPGSPLRRALMDALRPEISSKLMPPIEFVVKNIRVSDGWAFVRVMPQRPGGKKIDINKTPLMGDIEMMDGLRTEAILQNVNGEWRVLDYSIGSTDVWYESWCLKVPRAIMVEENGSSGCVLKWSK